MTSYADFMGGPMHGKSMAFPDDEPPPVFHIQAFASLPTAEKQAEEEAYVEVTQLHYERTVSTLDDGPLWTYVLKTNEEGAS